MCSGLDMSTASNTPYLQGKFLLGPPAALRNPGFSPLGTPTRTAQPVPSRTF